MDRETEIAAGYDFEFTKEGKLRHENHYLQERIKNLEIFKKNFFKQQVELQQANERIQILEQQLGLDMVRQRLTENNLRPGSSEISHYLYQTLHSNELDELAVLTFQAMEGWIDNASLLIRNDADSYSYNLDSQHGEKNQTLISEHIQEKGLIESPPYVIINCHNISLLAQLPETENEERKNLYTEFIHAIALSANARLNYLFTQDELEELQKNIYMIFKRTNQAFEDLQDDIANQSITISELYLGFENTLLECLNKLNIPEKHMDIVKQISGSTKTELNLLLTTAMTLDENFLDVLRKLESAYSKKYGDGEKKGNST